MIYIYPHTHMIFKFKSKEKFRVLSYQKNKAPILRPYTVIKIITTDIAYVIWLRFLFST